MAVGKSLAEFLRIDTCVLIVKVWIEGQHIIDCHYNEYRCLDPKTTYISQTSCVAAESEFVKLLTNGIHV